MSGAPPRRPTIQVVTDLDAILALETSWNAVTEDAAAPRPTQTFPWVASFFELGLPSEAEPLCVVAWDGDRVVPHTQFFIAVKQQNSVMSMLIPRLRAPAAAFDRTGIGCCTA